MTPTFDCVATYHANPLTCGVAKFNAILAARLGVPMLSIFDPALLEYKQPLLSIKCEEFTPEDMSRLQYVARALPRDMNYSLFFHAFSDTLVEFELIRRARMVFCGNGEIHRVISPHTDRVSMLWSPATLSPSDSGPSVGEITIFSFGMAHKLRAHHYLRLRELLEDTGKTYTIFLSTALHEGTSFESAFSASFEQLRTVFGDHVRFLGFLSDDAVLEYMRRSTFFTAFFERGVRDNNSSVLAAMEHGGVVITNLDPDSPKFCRHGETLLDIQSLSALPLDRAALEAISARARDVARDRSWDQLLARFAEGTQRA